MEEILIELDSIKKRTIKIEELLEKDVSKIFNENVKLKKEAENTKDYLSNIDLKLNKVTRAVDNNGEIYLKVSYDIPDIILTFDEDGNLIQNKAFKSINLLNLTSVDDMMKISDEIKNTSNFIKMQK